MNESIKLDNARIGGTVRDVLDEILYCVEAETYRIKQFLSGFTQRVVDELIREAIDARDRHNSGAGDVNSLRALIHNQLFLHIEQRQTIEGQFNVEPVLQNVFNSQQVTSNLNRSRSLTLLSTCFHSNTAATTDIKSSPSSRSLPACTFTQDQHDSDIMSNSLKLTCSQNDDSLSVTEDIDASKLTEDIPEYPTYEQMKTIKTSRGEIKVPDYCYDNMDDIDLGINVPDSKKPNDDDAQKESNKKIGVFSRVRKVFRRMCCCSVREEK